MTPPVLLTYLIFQDLSGKPATYDDFEKRLRRFSRTAVIRLCSILNMLLSKWEGDYDFEAHARLVRSFFPQRTAEAMIQTKRLAFHRHQLLFVAQEALRHCTDGGRDVMTPPYWGGFGVVLLMASELLYTSQPAGQTPEQDLARKISQLLPDMEANGLQSYLLKIVRAYVMTSQFIEPFRGLANFFDVPALFEQASGIPLETYQALLFGAVTRFIKLDELKKSQNPADFAVPDTWFTQTIVPKEQIERFFDYVSANAETFSSLVNSKTPRANDFTIFRDKPMFGEAGAFYPLDLSLLAEKFESGPFWKINSYLSPSDRGRFHSFWGGVFEAYINWLLARSVDSKKNHFYPNPTYAGRPSEQVCDGIVLSGRCAVLIEYKSSTFTTRAKYGGDPVQLDSELVSKLVGTVASRKGVYQLADAVAKLCKRENPDRIEGVSMSHIATVFPLIITRDDLGSAFYMNAYLNVHFQNVVRGKRFSKTVTPLFCLSADDMEKLSPYLVDTSLAEALSARLGQDRQLTSSFWIVENSAIKWKGERKPQLMVGESAKLGKMMAERLGLNET